MWSSKRLTTTKESYLGGNGNTMHWPLEGEGNTAMTHWGNTSEGGVIGEGLRGEYSYDIIGGRWVLIYV